VINLCNIKFTILFITCTYSPSTLLCNHHYRLPPEPFHLPRIKLTPIKHSMSHFQEWKSLNSPTLGTTQCSSFHVWLMSLSVRSSRFTQVTVCLRISFFYCLYTPYFVYPFIHGCLGYSHLWTEITFSKNPMVTHD
jgi:hypothetical protein